MNLFVFKYQLLELLNENEIKPSALRSLELILGDLLKHEEIDGAIAINIHFRVFFEFLKNKKDNELLFLFEFTKIMKDEKNSSELNKMFNMLKAIQ